MQTFFMHITCYEIPTDCCTTVYAIFYSDSNILLHGMQIKVDYSNVINITTLIVPLKHGDSYSLQ